MDTKPVLLDCPWLDLEKLRNSNVFVTGGTGLIGYNIIKELAALQPDLGLRIYALVRNEHRAKEKFREFADQVQLIQGDVLQKIQMDEHVDYVIHGASVTSSQAFVDTPVETIMTSVMGSRNLLEFAREKSVKSLVYLSSMEVYGAPSEKKLLTEDCVDYLDPMKLRSSYPESKRMCENLCVAYSHEYGVPVKVVRLAQTFGPGLAANDRRVIIQFLNSALAKEDIQIKASGESSRMYLYTADAVTGILSILLGGEDGLAYNLANKDTYCSIKELAQKVLALYSPENRVLTNTGTEEERRIYPPDSYLYLDTSRVEALGWRPRFGIEEAFRGLERSLQSK